MIGVTRRTHVLPIREAPPEGVAHHIASALCGCVPDLQERPDGMTVVLHHDPGHTGLWSVLEGAPDPWCRDLPGGLTPAGGG